MNKFIRKNAVSITNYMLLGMIMIGRIRSINIIDLAYFITMIWGIIIMKKESV